MLKLYYILPISKRLVCSKCMRIPRLQARKYATAATATADVYDVVCVGGGPAGLSLLTALRIEAPK